MNQMRKSYYGLQLNSNLAYYSTTRPCYVAYSFSLHSTQRCDVVIPAIWIAKLR